MKVHEVPKVFLTLCSRLPCMVKVIQIYTILKIFVKELLHKERSTDTKFEVSEKSTKQTQCTNVKRILLHTKRRGPLIQPKYKFRSLVNFHSMKAEIIFYISQDEMLPRNEHKQTYDILIRRFNTKGSISRFKILSFSSLKTFVIKQCQ